MIEIEWWMPMLRISKEACARWLWSMALCGGSLMDPTLAQCCYILWIIIIIIIIHHHHIHALNMLTPTNENVEETDFISKPCCYVKPVWMNRHTGNKTTITWWFWQWKNEMFKVVNIARQRFQGWSNFWSIMLIWATVCKAHIPLWISKIPKIFQTTW